MRFFAEAVYQCCGFTPGTPRYAESVAITDSILKTNMYNLDAGFAAVFAPDSRRKSKKRSLPSLTMRC